MNVRFELARSAAGSRSGTVARSGCPHARTRSCSWTWVLLSISFHEHVVVTSSSTTTRDAVVCLCGRAVRSDLRAARRTRRLRPDVGFTSAPSWCARTTLHVTPRHARNVVTVSTFKTSALPASTPTRPRPGTRAGPRGRGAGRRAATRPPTARGRAVPPETFLMKFRPRHFYELWICTIVYTVEGKLGGIA